MALRMGLVKVVLVLILLHLMRVQLLLGLRRMLLLLRLDGVLEVGRLLLRGLTLEAEFLQLLEMLLL